MQTLEDHPLFRPAMTGLLLLIGAGLLGFLLFAFGKDVALWVFGRHVAATVVDRWAEPVGDKSREELSFHYYVRYRFATPDGRIVTSVKPVAVQEWVGVSAGAHGSASVDWFDGSSQGPAAPVYQEQEHLAEFNAGMEAGGTVDVVYFPLYPAHNRMAEGRFVPLLACTYLPLFLLGGAALAGARQLLRAQRAEALAHRARWTGWQVANK